MVSVVGEGGAGRAADRAAGPAGRARQVWLLPASVLPLSTNRVVWVPPLTATKASSPTFSVLTSKYPRRWW